MKLRSQIVRVQFTAILLLLFCALAYAAVSIYLAYTSPYSMFRMGEIGRFVFIATFAAGFLPVVLFGAPLYLALHHKSMANWASVVLVGIFPGVIALFFDFALGTHCIIFGATIATFTHWVCRARL